tara:strand:- start:6080 stop:7648 length:1569 start_codon:yes stop_codon:yes gene_type:complete
MPAYCTHPNGTRYLVNAFENYANGISLSPEGEISNFAQFKEVKLDDQIIYADRGFPGAGFPGAVAPGVGLGGYGQPLPAPITPRATYTSDHTTAMYVLSSLSGAISNQASTSAFIEQLRQTASAKIKLSEEMIRAETIEIEVEDGERSTCKSIAASGTEPCTIYRCQSPSNGFYIASQFGMSSFISMGPENKLKSQHNVKTVWNPQDRTKPISESLMMPLFGPMMGYGSDQGLEQRMREFERQSARQNPTLESPFDPSLRGLLEPMPRMMLEQSMQACDSSEVAPLEQGIKAARNEVANAEMVQIVEVTNNVLFSRLINPDAIPENSCRDGDTWYRGQSFDLSRDILTNSSPKTIDMETATRLFNEARAMDDISWNYKMDGCYARAHLMARRFEEQGIHVDKVWIKGDLRVPEAGIQWNFHVAPIVYVEDAAGNVQKMVIDPSLMDGPVPVAQWSAKMEKGVVGDTIETSYPFPGNVMNLERTAIAYSNSDPYLPYDQINMSEEEKMRLASQTMETYLGYTQ